MNAIKIGFVLLSNSERPIPSTRIAALNMFPFLRAADFEPHVVFEPVTATETPDVSMMLSRLVADGFQIICFQKVHGPSVERLARELSTAGIKTVYCVCDLVNAGMVEATDATVVVTDFLRQQYPQVLQKKIHVVHDGIEAPDARKTYFSEHRGSRGRPLRAVLITSAGLDRLPHIISPPSWLKVTIVGRYSPGGRGARRCREGIWKIAAKKSNAERIKVLKFLVDPQIRCVAWSEIRACQAMREADIGIIPIDTFPEHLPGMLAPSWKVKSENRLTMKMCAGLPVIATPIPAYEAIMHEGQNGFLARSQADWRKYLEFLRDPDARQEIGARARASVITRYSMEAQATELISVLRKLIPMTYGQQLGTLPIGQRHAMYEES